MGNLAGFFRTSLVGALAAIGALTAGLVALPLALAAHDATPEPGGTIGPILWQLTSFEDSATGATPVDDPSRYTIQFLPDGRVSVGADCNRGIGAYTLAGDSLEFGPIATTLMLCEPASLSDQYLKELPYVRSYVIDQSEATDQLVLTLMADGGALRFSPSLAGVVWEWEKFEGGDGALVTPDDPSRYVLEFQADGTVAGQVDCNRGAGRYEVDGSSIKITLATTRMFCGEGSLDADFGRYIGESTSFVIRDGKLALSLPADGGIATFAPRFVESGAGATPEAQG